MKKIFAGAAKLIKRKDTEKDKAYNKNIDYEKVQRNIDAAKERLEDPNLTMCQRQEYQKALNGLKKYKKD